MKGYINGVAMKPPSRKGAIHTEEAKQKNRDKHLGKIMSAQTREKMKENWSTPNKGRFIKGQEIKHDKQFKKGQPSWIKGKHHSKESIEKMSLAHIGDIPWNLGKKPPPLSEEWRRKISESHKKIRCDCHLWRGGITPINAAIRSSFNYKEARRKCFERDEYTCTLCGARCGDGKKIILNADHIKPFAYFPELRFEITNLRTLCVDCHRKTDTYGNKAKTYANQR